jgi:hypothetical protein
MNFMDKNMEILFPARQEGRAGSLFFDEQSVEPTQRVSAVAIEAGALLLHIFKYPRANSDWQLGRRQHAVDEGRGQTGTFVVTLEQ